MVRTITLNNSVSGSMASFRLPDQLYRVAEQRRLKSKHPLTELFNMIVRTMRPRDTSPNGRGDTAGQELD